jgi:hypothetical protein
MKNHLLQYLVIILLGGSFISCSKSDSTPTVPTAGNMFGTIQTWDDKTISTSDQAGVTITITNLANKSTTTDAQGKYSFANLPYDQYDIEISKTGYGTMKVFGITHAYNAAAATVGATQIPNISFGKKSTTTVTALSVSGNNVLGEPGVSFSYTISPAPTPASRAFVRYFLSTTSDVSPTKYFAASAVVNFSNGSAITGFSTSQLVGMGFTSGQTVYAKMFGESFITNEYFQPNLGYKVFPNLNLTSPPAVSFVVP